MSSLNLALLNYSEKRELMESLQEKSHRKQTATLTASLTEFVRAAWPIIEPATPLIWNWHIDAYALHLTAITDGLIDKLDINVPPGSIKSSIISVLWPCWVWTRAPEKRFLFASHIDTLATRDSVRRRNVISSQWYQSMWPIRFADDNNQKSFFSNTKTGHMLSLGVGGNTGFRGDFLVLDDPNSATEMESEVQRASKLLWFDGQWSTRGNRNYKEVIIQQRTHEEDITGHALKQWTPGNPKTIHLKIPMEYAGEKNQTSLGYADPRSKLGELFFPAYYDAKRVEELKRRLGPYGYSGQCQQEPAPPEGGIIKRTWIRHWTGDERAIDIGDARFDAFAHFRFCTVDPAITEKDVAKKEKLNDPDYTVMAAWAVFFRAELPVLVLLDLIRDRMEGPEILEKLEAFHAHWKFSIVANESVAFQAALTQWGKRAGLPMREISTKIDAFHRIDKDKVARAYGATPLMADGRFYVPTYAPWLGEYVKELTFFPTASHDDMVDATTYAVAIAANMFSYRQGDEDPDQQRATADDGLFHEPPEPDPMDMLKIPAP